jgi:hypothetical protein
LNFLATALSDDGSVILLSSLLHRQQSVDLREQSINTTLTMSSKTNRYKVVVVGAGSAGLQCARTMQSDFGVPAKDVLVLEARSTVGGRIQQIDTFIPGHKVELGAEVCLINVYICFVFLLFFFFHVFFFEFFSILYMFFNMLSLSIAFFYVAVDYFSSFMVISHELTSLLNFMGGNWM